MNGLFAALRRVLALAVLALTPLAAKAADPPPLAAFGNLPEIESMALSHSGNRIAAVMTIGGKRMLLLLSSQLDQLRTLPLQDQKLRSMEWVGDERLVLVISQTTTLPAQYVASQFEFFHAIVVPVDPSQQHYVVFDGDPSIVNSVFGSYGIRQVDGRWLAYFSGVERERGARRYYTANGRTSLYGLDVERNTRRQLVGPPPDGASNTWLVGANGDVAATISLQLRNGSWAIKVPNGPVLAEGVNRRGEVGLVALGKDGTSVIYQERNPADSVTRWFEVPLQGGPAREFIKAEDVRRLFTDRSTGRMLGLQRMGAGKRPELFDPQHQAAIDKIYAAFPDLEVTVSDWSPDFSKALVRTTGNGDSGTWYLVDITRMRASAVGYERVAIEPDRVGPISTVTYKAADGLEIEGILTLPPGREAKNLPLVMLPHGGPHSHDEEVFDWWAQAFASRGYAVFQPNFRGSTNRDEAFMRAGFGQWGRAMQSDISDGLAELARRGVIDPKRACIVGASYGGYAALAGVTLQQGLYRCAVGVAPVSDLASLFAEEVNTGGSNGMLRRSLLEELGPRSGFDAVSPRYFAAQADAPILLIHGKDDTVVPFDQSDRMADALRRANKPHRLVVLREEDHWLSRAGTRLQMLEEAVAFVQQHNPAG